MNEMLLVVVLAGRRARQVGMPLTPGTRIGPYQVTAAIGEGVLLSPASYQELISKSLAGFGVPIEGCATCMTLSEQVPFGAGIWMIGDWLAQIPAFGGYAAFTVYLPSRKLAIAISVTVNEAAFDDKGNFLLPNPSVPVGAAIAGLLAPEFPLAGNNPAP